MPLLPLREDEIPNNPPPKVDGQRWYYPYIRISGGSIDLKGTAEGRYGEYFASGSASGSHHVFEFACTHPVVTRSLDEFHVYGRWVIATLASSSANANFGAAVAVATATGSGSVKSNQFRGRTRGIDDAHWENLRELSASLDGGAAQELGGALAQALQWCVQDARTGTSEPGSVFLLQPGASDRVLSTLFALNRIKRGDSLEQAEEQLNQRLVRRRDRERFLAVDPLVVAATYHRMGVGRGKTPSSETSRLARRILAGDEEIPPPNSTLRGYWYDLPPYRLEDGAVPELLRLSPDRPERVAVNPWPIAPQKLSPSSSDFGGSSLYVQTALRVSGGGLVDVNIDADASYFTHGFMSAYAADGPEGSLVLHERYSVGFRVRVRQLSADANTNVTAIAAAGSVQSTDVAYEIEGLGLNLGGLEQIPAVASAIVNRFDLGTLSAIGSLHNEASRILSDQANPDEVSPDFKPVLSAVQLDLGAPEIQALVSDRAQIEERARRSLLGNRFADMDGNAFSFSTTDSFPGEGAPDLERDASKEPPPEREPAGLLKHASKPAVSLLDFGD